jgi:fucose 4-O-acetylase-like acetyltransferase
MASCAIGGTGQSQEAQRPIARLFFIDNWRSALIILVILNHLAFIYGAGAIHHNIEPLPADDLLAFRILMAFILISQSWYMGAFFLISGHFTPGSFDRKGLGAFLKDRLMRLGVPLVAFIFVINPISLIGYRLLPISLTGITIPLSWRAYPRMIAKGPLWFVALLLIFDFGYAAWRAVARRQPTQRVSAPPGYLAIGVFITGLALASYLMRTAFPLDKSIAGFPTPTFGYLPQYLSFFLLGTAASRGNWFRTLSGKKGKVGLSAALAATLLLLPIALTGFSPKLVDAARNVAGRGHWQSAVYSLWDSIVSVGMCLGMIALFRRFLDRMGKFASFLSRHGFAVYIINLPSVVFLAVLLNAFKLEPLLKFALAAVTGVPLCFGIAFLVRKIPLAPRIL